MPYCTNCGRGYTTADRYCERCGRLLGAAATLIPSTEHTDYLASSIERALARTDERRRRRRNAVSGSNEGLDIYIRCIAIIAFIHGLSLMLGRAMSSLLDGPVGLLMMGGVVLGASFKVAFDRRLGYSLGRSLIETIIIGAVLYGMIYGAFWYLTETFLHTGKSLLTFPGVSTPTPKP
jgi:hypothetical protein